MIDDRTVQHALAARHCYSGPQDGAFGNRSRRAIRHALQQDGHPLALWIDTRCRCAFDQILMREAGIETGPVDGLMGPQTRIAFERWQDRLRGQTPGPSAIAHQPSVFPRQKDVPSFFGRPGQRQTMLDLPYPMRLAWDTSVTIRRFSIHEKVRDSANRALRAILDHYGAEAIRQLGLDLFGGCLNQRKMRGGKARSMHSWGIAIDFDPAHNQLRWGRDRARLAMPARRKFLDIWEQNGWISIGRERNFDWMHVQAARF